MTLGPIERLDYSRGRLDIADVDVDPLVQAARWIDEAAAAGVVEPTGMALSTVDTVGRPSSRNVLLRGLDHGFVFFTNYRSAKGRDLDANPACALLFSWLDMQRQLRVAGDAEQLEAAASDEYFEGRPRDSQLGAWASPQSEVIADRSALEDSFMAVTERFAGEDVSRPPHWGGYRVIPREVELWQGRPNRLHDRIRYRRDAGRWVIERLAP